MTSTSCVANANQVTCREAADRVCCNSTETLLEHFYGHKLTFSTLLMALKQTAAYSWSCQLVNRSRVR
jgi:hypothetical protein